MDWIGKKATGTRWDMSTGRVNFRDSYRYGYRMRGIITAYNKKKRKYEIEGARYVITPEGEFRIGRGKDYFFVSQIQFEDSTPPDPAPAPAEAEEPASEEEPGPSPDPNLNSP